MNKFIELYRRYISCPHKTEWVQSEFSINEQYAFCAKCGKDLTKTLRDYYIKKGYL